MGGRMYRSAGAIARVTAGIGVAALIIAGPQSLAASPESSGFSADRLHRLDTAMQAQIDSGRYAAISVMIARHGQVIKDGRYGYQDLESRAPLRPDAIFRIASMTKPVTGVAMMILFEEGKFQLDDPVSKFIPQFANLMVSTAHGPEPLDHAITIRELLTSVAGFAGGYPINSSVPAVDEAYARAHLTSGTLADMIEKLSRLGLESQPGAKFRYGVQHDIQGYLVERISGRTFDRFLAERIFQPLGMVDTGFGVPSANRKRIVPLYTYDAQGRLTPAADQGGLASAAGETPTFLSGGSGLYSTMADYMRFAKMLARGGELDGARILAPSTVHLMMSDLLPENVHMAFLQTLVGVGYGVDLGIILDPGRASFNSGGIGKGTAFWTGSHGTWFWVDPVNDLIVLGMTQQQGAAAAHVGLPSAAPDIRALSRSLIYQALVDPSR